MVLSFTGERIVPGAADCEPTFAQKMYQEHVARYAFAAQFASGADVLDVGCGVGYGSQFLAKAGAKSVLGFDLSEEAIEHARMHYFHPAVSFKTQNANDMEPGNGYDLVTCFELIEHIAEQESVIDLIKEALREDGVLVISTPRPLDDIRTHYHMHEMSFEELLLILKQRFRHVEYYFEVNCFTSFVGAALPDRIEQVVSISDRINLNHADYFIFVASNTPIGDRATVRPLLSMNDDSYVLTLEHDVGVLRRAENDHLARIADLEREKGDLANAHAAADQRGNAIDAVRHDTGMLREAFDQLNGRLTLQSAVQVERDVLINRVQQLETELRLHASQVERVTRELACAARPERIAELEAALAQEQQASAARLAGLDAVLQELRRTTAEQVAQRDGTLEQERQASAARLNELEAIHLATRQAAADRLAQCEAELAQYQQTSATRIAELETAVNVATERAARREAELQHQKNALERRLEELNADVSATRQTAQEDIAEQEALLQRERDAYAARIEELENNLSDAHQAAQDDKAEQEALLERERDAYAARIEELETSLSDQRRAAADEASRQDAALENLRETSAADLDTVRRTLAATAEELVAAQTKAFRVGELEAMVAETRQNAAEQIAQRDAAIAGLRDSNAADLDSTRRALAAMSEQLAAAQTEAFGLRESAGRLPEFLERAAALENELYALRYRFEQSEATLARFRGSISWAITRPIRWTGRTYRKMTGRN